MPAIVIRLDPALLSNPDLDLRYEIPYMLMERASGLVSDAGYDYELGEVVTGDEAMQIYLGTPDLGAAVELVVSFLRSERLHGNDLLAASMVGVSDDAPERALSFRVVHPTGHTDEIRVPAHGPPPTDF